MLLMVFSLFIIWLFFHKYVRSRAMENIVVISVSYVKMNEVMHLYTLEWIFKTYLFHSPTVLIFQCTVFLPSMWWLCTFLPVLIWGVGYALLENILPPNHLQPRWNLLGRCSMSIVPGSCLRDGIHKVPGVGKVHNVQFILLVGVHTYPWSPTQICIHCKPCPWDCIHLWIILG